MVVDRTFGQDQRRGNLAVAASLYEQAEHFKLTFTEPADARSAPPQSVTSDCENSRGGVVVGATSSAKRGLAVFGWSAAMLLTSRTAGW